jgi:hypothetical protein
MNDNTEYEIFTQEIYQLILNAEGYNTIKVEHDILLKGSHGQEYQIDVYWEIKIAGIIHRVAIECKNYSKKIPVGKIRDFFGVVHDIGNIFGIIVSMNGFQSGAIQYAFDHGIKLIELRYPNRIDFSKSYQGIQKVSIGGSLYARQLIEMNFIVDKDDFVLKHPELRKGQQINFYYEGDAKETYLYDSDNQKVISYNDIWLDIPTEYKAGKNFEYTYKNDNIYADTNNWGRIKLEGIKFVFDIHEIKQCINIDIYDFVRALHKDIITGEIKAILHTDSTHIIPLNSENNMIEGSDNAIY